MSFHRLSRLSTNFPTARVSDFPTFHTFRPPLGAGKLESGKDPGKSVEKLTNLATQVARLCPDHRDPEAFHIQKSEIVATLRRLARDASR